MAIKFSDVLADNGPMKGLYISEKNAKASREMFAGYPIIENIEVTMTLNLEDAPMIKSGPHMFDELCHCESCSSWRAQRDAGMHIDINTVRQEAELTRLMARNEWERGFFKGTQDDPVMSIPCSVVLALCEQASGDLADYKEKAYINQILRKEAEIKRLRSDVEKLDGILAGHEIGTAFFVDKGLPPLPAPNSAMTAESIVACVQHGIARSGK